MRHGHQCAAEKCFAGRTVSCLVCHAHVPMAVNCLGSLLRLCAEPLSLRLHDDGTLTDEDIDILTAKLEPSEIIARREADARVADQFGAYKNIRSIRKVYPQIMKAFDAVLFNKDPVFACIDADVLFLRRFHNPFRISRPGVGAVFMRDRAPSYSLRSWQKLASSKVRLPNSVNVGMIAFDMGQIDLDLLEWFVADWRHNGIPSMIEQTFWAMLGMRVGCRVFDPRQVRVMREGEGNDDLVVGHFTARTRHLLPEFVRLSQQAQTTTDAITLRTIDAGTCTAWDLLLYEVRRLAKRAGGIASSGPRDGSFE